MDQVIEIAEIHTRGLFLVLLCSKCAIKELNALMKFATQEWKNSNNFRMLRKRITIKETVESEYI